MDKKNGAIDEQFTSIKHNAWDNVNIARSNTRPTSRDYIENIFDNFIEFHGDRAYGDDKSTIGGIALLNDIPITVIGQQKGRDLKGNIECNFGMPYPEGYRKALRLMKQAEKFGRPIISFVDTPGAYCGLGAEERGQGHAIANNLFELSDLKVPMITIVIGEGGSGGALALSIADEIWMMEYAVYSILSPEGFASILWKDSTKAKEAAELMKLTSFDLFNLKIADKIVPEPDGGITMESGYLEPMKYLKELLVKEVKTLKSIPV
ncbi:MAG: acetyl-CoA carboxylase carboxyltransferase subunit alpha, partial [Eubacteriaceae bacterium]|nr:acetyl-CoA carboxylase carboxyltransferase subunit alpha [Eubacteriaceae bacterium]